MEPVLQLTHPAYLLVGQLEEAKKEAIRLLKGNLCPRKGCNACVFCTQIDEQRHHGVRWLAPDGQFKVEQIALIFQTICYALEPGQQFFFVLERADLLAHAAANSLLKSLEEPPTGYHFILLSPWVDGVLPTIVSRCITLSVESTAKGPHPLLAYFKHPTMQLVEFAKELDKYRPHDKEVYDLFDELYQWYALLYKKSYLSTDAQSVELQEKYKRILDFFDEMRLYPAMPGSGRFFLKNLYIHCFLL